MLVGEGQLEEGGGGGAYPVEDAQYMPCCCLQVHATKFVVCIILVHSSSHSYFDGWAEWALVSIT